MRNGHADKKVLLLNPPGRKLYIRDYYCSKVSKSSYLFHPIDLLMLSGRLHENYDLFFIDAIADRIDIQRCYEKIEAIAPDVIISLIGAVSNDEDIGFLQKLKKTGRKILVTGDITIENTKQWLWHHPFVDAVILDFTSENVVSYLQGTAFPFLGIVYRKGKKMIAFNGEKVEDKQFNLPVPRHELFSSPNYRFPFVRHQKFATVLTDYGCPYNCSFCVMSTLEYKYRRLENVIEELRVLKKLDKKELFFLDQTFGVNKKQTFELCQRMNQEQFGFGWVCYSRVDIINDEMLAAMKGAGCHTIIFGVEAACDEILKTYQKGYTKSQIRNAFNLCKRSGIRTVATFIIGLPEDTAETIAETIDFLKEIDCDFASFNVAVPRVNTKLRQDAIKEGLIRAEQQAMDQAGSTIAMPTRRLTREQVQSMKRKAVMSFYVRPIYLWKRLKGISSFYELREHIYEAWSLLKGI